MSSFEEFLAGQTPQISVWGLLINLVIAGIFAWILGQLYIRFGNSLSNRRMFAREFVLLIMTTTLIITVIKSSLALSLGLVGALSIVRFRTAIKEPEELTYLFVAIALGLGLGADQRLITTIAFATIIAFTIVSKKTFHKTRENQNLHINVASQNPGKVELSQIVTVLKNHCSSVSMKRFDESREMLDVSFLVGFEDYSQLEKAKDELRKLSESIKITFLDPQGRY
ncbi:DUF4956 domain-containing protein [Chloroflexota bacterium]